MEHRASLCISAFLISALALLSSLPSVFAAAEPVAWWSFDESAGPTALDRSSGKEDPIRGHFGRVPGAVKTALLFDGFTTRVVRPAASVPALTEAWAIESWIAPQEYSWAWTGIVDMDQDGRAGYSLGINYVGKIGFYAAVDGKWQGCESKEPVPLLKWAHLVGAFDPAGGFTLYINGQVAGRNEAAGRLKPAEGLDLFIGMSHRKQCPEMTMGQPSRELRSNMIFDGLIDEVKLYSRALTTGEVMAAFTEGHPHNPQPLQFRVLPSGPKGPRPFGAYYTRLSYCPEWDRLWRTGDYADVLVTFGDLPVRLIFWRGTGYCPAWVTEDGKWVSDQGPESWNANGCCEHMSDKRCVYSHVRILENTEARAVVHWRTASPDITYGFNHVDPDTGWGEWTDEYYYIYPDAVAVRYQEVHGAWAANMEWQQTELLNQPGTRPQDNVETEAMTVFNLNGESETWTWETSKGNRRPGDKEIKDGIIQVMNLKSPQRHFVIGETGARWEAFRWDGLAGFSTMTCWNHWPVAQLPNDGRRAPEPDRPSSTCFGTLYPVKHPTDRPDRMTARNLYGLTDKPAKELTALARSWNFPAELSLRGEGLESHGYDQNQRAYVLGRAKADATARVEFGLAGSEKSPVLNPAFVVRNWGDDEPKLRLNGESVPRGKAFRFGHYRTLDGIDLIVWIKVESRVPVNVSIAPR